VKKPDKLNGQSFGSLRRIFSIFCKYLKANLLWWSQALGTETELWEKFYHVDRKNSPQRPYTFTVLAVLLLIGGALSTLQMAKDIFPAINIPVVGDYLDLRQSGWPPV
jgi:hypothetical protein